MEIITYVREGAITHQNNLGDRGRTEAGDVQVMSVGAGIAHSEYALEDVIMKIFQIWIQRTGTGGKSGWSAKPFPKGERSGQFVILASGFDHDGEALPIRTDARVAGATIKVRETVEYLLNRDRRGYLVPAIGALEIDGKRVGARDGAAISDVDTLQSPQSMIARWCW